MTPRESLEAAGWKPWNRRGWWESPDGNSLLVEPEAVAQLARDEAKETSDVQRSGNVNCIGDVNRHGSTANPPDSTGTPPVATSVSAPESAEQFYAKSAFNFVWYRSNGDIFEFAEAYAREYSSSSSAAPKWDENGILWWAGIGHISVFQRNQDVRKIEAERDTLRDSRDRLHEEFDVMRLRALSAEKIARIPIRTQDEEFIARRAALDPVPDTE